MKSCVTTFRIISSTGDQTITGIVDIDGNTFTPKALLFLSGSTVLNTLYYNPTATINCIAHDMGLYLASGALSSYSGIAVVPQFGGKITSGAAGTRYAVCSLEGDLFFGGNIYRIAEVTDVRLGEFDISVVTNLNFLTTDIIVVALGGDDLELESIGIGYTNGNHPVSFEPKGLLRLLINSPLSSGGVSTGAGGGGGQGFGWDAPDNGPSSTHILWEILAGNYRLQRTDTFQARVDGLGHTVAGIPVVSSWNVDSYDVTGNVDAGACTTIAIGGTNIICTSRVVTQPIVIGHQTINLGIAPQFVILASYGAEADTGVKSDVGELVTGVTDGTRQACYWAALSSSAQPLDGASLLSDESILRFATPAAGSTVFDAVAEFIEFEDDTLILNWTTVDSTPREIIVFAIGIEFVPPPSVPGAGIYKVVTDKRHDTLYDTLSPVTTSDVKIP